MKKKKKRVPKQRDFVAKDLLTNGLYKRKIHVDRKKQDRMKHKED